MNFEDKNCLHHIRRLTKRFWNKRRHPMYEPQIRAMLRRSKELLHNKKSFFYAVNGCSVYKFNDEMAYSWGSNKWIPLSKPSEADMEFLRKHKVSVTKVKEYVSVL